MTRWPESGEWRGRGAEAPQETRRWPERERRPQELREQLLERARLELLERARPVLQERTERQGQHVAMVPVAELRQVLEQRQAEPKQLAPTVLPSGN